jgi:hypothetical protein
MYIFINDISKTAFRDFHAPLWSINPESFMRFGNTRCKRGRDPMEIPFYHKTIYLITFQDHHLSDASVEVLDLVDNQH